MKGEVTKDNSENISNKEIINISFQLDNISSEKPIPLKPFETAGISSLFKSNSWLNSNSKTNSGITY